MHCFTESYVFYWLTNLHNETGNQMYNPTSFAKEEDIANHKPNHLSLCIHVKKDDIDMPPATFRPMRSRSFSSSCNSRSSRFLP